MGADDLTEDKLLELLKLARELPADPFPPFTPRVAFRSWTTEEMLVELSKREHNASSP